MAAGADDAPAGRAAGDPGLLAQGLDALGLQADELACERLLAYLDMIRRWGKAYNLVAPGEMPRLLTRHLLDALSIAPWCGDGPLLDVGTGAGFPGLPLAVLNPGRETVLLDSAGKKIRFLRHVVRTLELGQVTPMHKRVEDFEVGGIRAGAFAGTTGFSTITSRAFCTLAEFARATRHLAGPDTRLLAMKGRDPAAEIQALPRWAQLCSVEPLSVPGLQAQRHLVIMTITPND